MPKPEGYNTSINRTLDLFAELPDLMNEQNVGTYPIEGKPVFKTGDTDPRLHTSVTIDEKTYHRASSYNPEQRQVIKATSGVLAQMSSGISDAYEPTNYIDPPMRLIPLSLSQRIVHDFIGNSDRSFAHATLKSISSLFNNFAYTYPNLTPGLCETLLNFNGSIVTYQLVEVGGLFLRDIISLFQEYPQLKQLTPRELAQHLNTLSVHELAGPHPTIGTADREVPCPFSEFDVACLNQIALAAATIAIECQDISQKYQVEIDEHIIAEEKETALTFIENQARSLYMSVLRRAIAGEVI